MKITSKTLVSIALTAAFAPAIAGGISLGSQDRVQGPVARRSVSSVNASMVPKQPPEVTTGGIRPSLPGWIGLTSHQLQKKGYAIISGCAVARPDPILDPDGLCAFDVSLYADRRTYKHLAIVLSKTPLKEIPEPIGDAPVGDFRYISIDAIAAPADPSYEFELESCKLDGRSDPAVFGFRYNKNLIANKKDPDASTRHGQMLKAWRTDRTAGKMVPLDPARVECKSDS